MSTDVRVIDNSHGHTYNVYGSLSQNIGATVGSNDASGKKTPRPPRRCPAPSTHYTRREGIENHMDVYFFGNQRGQKRYVLHGLGGSGKTEAANAFIHRHYYSVKRREERRFTSAFWVDATSTLTITESLQDIAESVGVETEDVPTWFANCDGENGDWIILFNNADDPKVDLSTYFPDCSHGNILITTRNRESRRFGVGPESAYGVSTMTAEESQGVLLSHLQAQGPSSSSVLDDIASLAHELGHFPLSLGQAGAFIMKTRFTPKRYLTMLRTRREQLLAEQEKMKHPGKYEYTSIQAAWLISFERLSPGAKQLLWLCAFLHHDGILRTIFEYMCTNLDEYERKYPRLMTDDERAAIACLQEFRRELFTDGSWNEFKFNEVIGELESFSLVLYIPEREAWSIHPLVHEWARNTLKEDQQVTKRQQVYILLSSARGRTVEERAFDGLLALHVDEVLKNTDVAFNGCWNELGFIYKEAKRWDDEVVLRMRYKEACKKILGDEDEDTLGSMANLAITYWEQSRLEDAATLQLQVMETRKRKLGDDHLQTLTSMSHLATTYWQQNRIDDAATLQLQVMETRKRKLGDDHLDTLTSMAHLANTYRQQGRLNDAATLELQVMEALKRKLGDDHLETLTSMGNLAVTYHQQGRLDDAAMLQLQVMETRKRKLGDDHLETLTSISHLANTYRQQGRLKDAATLELQVMETLKRKLGDDHLQTLTSMGNLAVTYYQQGRLDDAATLQLQVMETRKRKLGDDHLQTLTSMAHLAYTYRQQERLDDAATLQLQVMEMLKRKLGDDHLETLTSMAHLANTYQQQGRLDDAATLQLQVMETRKRKLGDDHLETLTSIANLAITYHQQGRLDDAADMLLQAVDGLTQKLGVGHSNTRNAVKWLERVRQDIEARNTQIENSIPTTHSTKDSQDVSKVLVDPSMATNHERSKTRYPGIRIASYYREVKRKLRQKPGSD